MPLLAKLFRRAPSRKASRVARLLAVERLGRPVWTPRDYAALAREGFMQNAVAHRCVTLVSEAAAAVPLILYEGERQVVDHALLRLLARPNPRSGGIAFLETAYAQLLVAGNAYVEAVALDGVV